MNAKRNIKKSPMEETLKLSTHIYTQGYKHKDVYCSIISNVMNWKQLKCHR